MLDDLRNEATFIDVEPEIPRAPAPPPRHFLGMKPFQRFFLAVLLLTITLLLSGFCLLLSGKVVLPF